MTLSGKFEVPLAKSGIILSAVTLQERLQTVRGAGIKHLINAVTAQSLGGVVKCNDLVSGAEVLSAWAAPTIDTAINAKPTLTFGTGSAGINGQLLRPKRYGALDLGTGAWSICMLVKAMGTGSADVVIGPERMATMLAGHYSPFIRIAASGDKTLAPVLLGNDGVARSVCNTHEFYNTVRVLLLCGTPGVGLTWYIDNWSTPAATSVTPAAKEAFTDGTFVIGGYGPALSSQSLAGSLAYISAHNVDLSLNMVARRDLMTEVASYGGKTST